MMWRYAELPANYTEDDPLDISGMQAMVDDLKTNWWLLDTEDQRKTIANAFRAALISPRQHLKWNAIIYQDLLPIPPEESDPNVFEQAIRDRKSKWDKFGQQTLDLVNENAKDQEWIDHGPQIIEKYMPGLWTNIRRCASIGPYIEQLRQIALEDIAQGGDGRYFRQQISDLGIQGIGPKVTSFVWLLLAPQTSRLATVDVHMMRVLGQEAESPKDYGAYLNFEQQLDQKRQEMGYDEVPLGAFQWALWDQQRTPGYHQDHTPLRPHQPIDWRNIDWTPSTRSRKVKLPEQSDEQTSLPIESKWQPLPSWDLL